MAAEKLLPWAKPLLVSSTLTQATIYVLRPMITYRAIELDGNSAQIGLIAALYALFPVLLALQFGSWVGKLGEAKFIIYGTLAMMVTSGALIFANNLVTLGIATAAAITYPLFLIHNRIGSLVIARYGTPTNQYFIYLIVTAALIALAYGMLKLEGKIMSKVQKAGA